MREYWVNVYEGPNWQQVSQIAHATRLEAMKSRCANAVYRIHVKLK